MTLAGGNMDAVERDGDTVLRTAGPWTARSRMKAAELGKPHLCDHAAGYERDAAALAQR